MYSPGSAMRSLLKYVPLVSLLLMALGALETGTVLACSGGEPLSMKGLINHSDFLVRARPVEVDDVRQNAILHVESYLAGGPGPEYLLFTQNEPVIIEYAQEGRSSGGDCIGFRQNLYQDEPFYVFLSHNFDGSYRAVAVRNPDLYFFPTPESTVEVYVEGGYNENGQPVGGDFAARGSEREVMEIEFLQIIAEQSGEFPSLPLPGSPYPLYAPMKVTTSVGTDYFLPVDGQLPIEFTEELRQEMRRRDPMWGFGFSDAGRCEGEDCAQFSPNGLDIAVQTDEDTITLIWGETVPGQASLFSSTNDTIAVWNDSELQVYRLRYPRFGYDDFRPQLLTEVALNNTDLPESDNTVGVGAWTPDGRMLAYSDAEGLWLWDVFTPDIYRRLLLSAEDGEMPYPRYFSPLGRYLAFAQGDTLGTLDIITGTLYPDGFVSPDDRLLLAFDTTAEVIDLQMCQLAPFSCQPIFLTDNIQLSSTEEIQDYFEQIKRVEWQTPYSFLSLGCDADEPMACRVFIHRNAHFGWYDRRYTEGYEYDYDSDNDSLAVVSTGSIITVDNRQQFDLSQWLDGDIVSVEWRPSLFYRE